MCLLISLLLLLLPTIVCVPQIRSDERDNLLIDAGMGKNITAFADSMLLNGEEIVTKDDILSIFNTFQTTITQLNASTQTEINGLRIQNQKLLLQLSQLNTTTITQVIAWNSFTAQTTNDINTATTKLAVLQPQIDQSPKAAHLRTPLCLFKLFSKSTPMVLMIGSISL